MELASRIISILLGAAVMLFVLWPVTIPVGFGEVWWASRKAQSPMRAAPGNASKPGAATPAPASVPASPHAVFPGQATQRQAPSEPVEVAPAPAVAAAETQATGATGATPATPTHGAPKLYRRILVRDGGTLQAGKIVIRLAGISARAADAMCADGDGKTWPCGTAAKTALARFIRGRAVACTLPNRGEHNIVIAHCSVGGDDLSAWLVRQGWAEPRDPLLAKAGDAAKKARLGLWRSGE